MPDTIIEERYYPVGHTCVELVAGVEVCRRFVYDAEVRDLVSAVLRSYPKARQDRDRDGFDAVARYSILRYGPDNPGNVLTVAVDMGLEEVQA
jgi:hypothetical protein